ncbi:MAG: polyphosphate polymerase domain-containing protein [Calditrichae bacterium]|nr:polyphosphate polymerase domain-containing protein [Calditrichia bacterium]
MSVRLRNEFKYLVPREKLAEIRAELAPYVYGDQHAQDREVREYTVRSIYFDSRNYEDYRAKVEGLKIRKKLRIRAYNEVSPESSAYLEIKRKRGGYIFKDRAPFAYQDIEALFESRDIDRYIPLNGSPAAQDSARKFFFHLHRGILRPTVLVIYDREAFFSKFDPSLRLTFDKALRSVLTDKVTVFNREIGLRYAMPSHFIWEIKFPHSLPAWVQSIIRHHRLPRLALSKYTICLDSHKSNGRVQVSRFSPQILPLFFNKNGVK